MAFTLEETNKAKTCLDALNMIKGAYINEPLTNCYIDVDE